MTRPERTNQRNLDFSRWIRIHLRDSFHGLIVHDIDWIIVNYCTGYFIIVEQKTCHQTSQLRTNPAQTVIFKMLDEMFSKATEVNLNERFSTNPATNCVYTYQGAFLLEFADGTDPDTASQIFVNGQPIIRDDLICLLNLEENCRPLLARYRSNWIEQNLAKQKARLKGNCP
ncbi:MAG: hypothetical protein J7L94_01030 [Caldisericaceae bacterium]|nr:hypothetical protein [Caldisericaceae bacterium]